MFYFYLFFGYSLIGAIFYVVSPIFYRLIGWRMGGDPSPEVLAFIWPVTFGLTTIYYLICLIIILLSLPIGLVSKGHRWVNYIISPEAQAKREEKNNAKIKEQEEFIAKVLKESQAAKVERWEKENLAYREANCNGCGQSLLKA